MSLLPDPDTLRAIAARVAVAAETTRARATALHAAIQAAQWHGPAAQEFRALAGTVVTALRTSASELDRAAAALRRTAGDVADFYAHLHRLGVDLSQSGGDVLRMLRDGTDAATILTHPDVLLADAGSLVHDGVHLAGDGVHLVEDGASAVYHGAGSVVGTGLHAIGLR